MTINEVRNMVTRNLARGVTPLALVQFLRFIVGLSLADAVRIVQTADLAC